MNLILKLLNIWIDIRFQNNEEANFIILDDNNDKIENSYIWIESDMIEAMMKYIRLKSR